MYIYIVFIKIQISKLKIKSKYISIFNTWSRVNDQKKTLVDRVRNPAPFCLSLSLSLLETLFSLTSNLIS